MKYLAKFTILLLFSLLVYGCNNSSEKNNQPEIKNSSEKLINAVLWMQNSAEYRACCYQAFNYGKLAVEKYMLENKCDPKHLAVVFDLDETLLDNSFYEAELILKNKEFYKYKITETIPLDTTKIDWKRNWTFLKKTQAIPGAIKFVEFINSKNINIIYISNRENDEKEATIENMEKILKFPKIDTKNYVFCKIDGKSSKTIRRDSINELYNVILYVGDNLADFEDIFEKRTDNNPNRFQEVDSLKEYFGSKYIILPNPMYGKWEDLNKDKNIKDNLKGINNIK